MEDAKLLIINLTARTYRTEIIPEKIVRHYIGGRGLGAYLLYKNLPAGTDPLSSENVLIFTAGPAQNLSVPFSPKAVLTTKSPLTGIYLYSVSSGAIGHNIRKAGYMAIMIIGKAEEPLYLHIADEKVTFHKANHLWGKDTLTTQKLLLDETKDKRASTAVIGPGGEKLILYASIITEGDKFRAFARGGPGCVMGSKNLKGLVISGTKTYQPADPEALSMFKRKIAAAIRENSVWAELRRRYGTGDDMPFMNKVGMLPTRNWQTGVWEEDKLKGIAPMLNAGIWPRKNISCGPYCPNPCSHYLEIKSGPYAGVAVDGPEYETMYAFGSNLGIDKFDAVAAAASLCDLNGIDTISTGLTISFLTECYEKGLIDRNYTEGIELAFGNDEAVIQCLKKIIAREGIGHHWGEGTRHLSATINGSSSFAMHCKGLEMGGYECRAFYGQALQFAINPKGGDHHGMGLPARSEAADGSNKVIKGKGEYLKEDAIGRVIADSAVVCVFPRKFLFPLFHEMLTALTGFLYSPEEVTKAGMRIIAQERLFNVREGLGRKDDTLPPRLLKEPLPDGPYKGSIVPLEELKDEAYRAFGWDLETGEPTPQLLSELEVN